MFAKNIIDIYLKDNIIGTERSIKTTRKELESQIAALRYSGERLPKIKIAEETDLPPFIVSFYYFIFSKNRIPTETEIFDTYLSMNNISAAGDSFIYKNRTIPTEGLRARLLRTYPSMIRDFHFYILLKESNVFSQVFYSLQNDFFKGLDLKVTYKSKDYYVSIYLESSRGIHYKTKKYSRHDYSQISEITMEVNKESMFRCGNISLLSDKHLHKLIEKIENVC